VSVGVVDCDGPVAYAVFAELGLASDFMEHACVLLQW
jgi:hypothetical protein